MDINERMGMKCFIKGILALVLIVIKTGLRKFSKNGEGRQNMFS